ncbi:hypothetical protein [Bradyrhizobium sp. Leo121]|uniref:hypothetical protein n=1 Tax=Bradyrhizobium sp. Leo121 TaxID=1571195 RepID=UPI0010299833|nr:hypothetical protein [Bradyrhizobium sp. Leo121]RZN24766.1 hypothetical protein CWO90_28405 [Bradyrhizobium sp. Leo121]
MAQKPLSEQFAFGRDTPIIGNLTKLVAAIDARFAALAQMEEKVNATLDGVVSLALQRLNETFTPLIVEAQQRLEQFGAAFGATSQSTLDVSLGVKTLVIDEDRRVGFIYSDYVALRAIENDAISMLAHVTDYQRDSGELSVDVVQIPENAGASYTGWKVNISAAPDLAHAGRTDNPHHTTAEQVGAYTTTETDAVVANAVAGAQDAINNYINGLGFMRQSLNLSDLVDKAAARANLGAQVAGNYQAALGYTPVNKAGDMMSGSLTVNGDLASRRAGSPGTGILYLGNSGARYLYFDGANYSLPGAHVYSAAGRLLGTGSDAGLVINGRLAYAADTSVNANGMSEPYGGAVMTGFGWVSGVATQARFRYMQLQNLAGGWWTIGYA